MKSHFRVKKYTNTKELIKDLKKGKLNGKWVWLDERAKTLKKR